MTETVNGIVFVIFSLGFFHSDEAMAVELPHQKQYLPFIQLEGRKSKFRILISQLVEAIY